MRRSIKLEPLPCIVLAVLVAVTVAIVFLAPPENASTALSATSVLGLVIQAALRAAFRIEAPPPGDDR